MASYYRKNKWGEDVNVERYHCGSCKYYDFEDEDPKRKDKSKCTYEECGYKCDRDDKCNDWEEAYDLLGGGWLF